MTVTAKLLEATKSGNGWKLKVEYTDGEEVGILDHRMNGVTTQDLINFVRGQANVLVEVKSSDYTVHIGQTIDITPPESIPPTAEQLAEIEFMENWELLGQMLLAAERGMVEVDDSRLIAQQAKTKTLWLDSYIGLI